jgi:hypothetical protein
VLMTHVGNTGGNCSKEVQTQLNLRLWGRCADRIRTHGRTLLCADWRGDALLASCKLHYTELN